MTRWLTLAAFAALVGQTPGSPGGGTIEARAVAWFAAREAAFVALRHDLHRHPELSGAEVRTAGVVADRLKRAGLEVTAGVGGHGVVALLRGGKPGAMVAYRADMDAVRSVAPDPVEYKSTTPGVRHICGHDVHTTIGVALAESLASVRADLAGSVLFLFQPAEETATGANAMLAAGALATHAPKAIFAVHTAPMPVGELVTARETLMPARDRARFTIAAPAGAEAAMQLRTKLPTVSTITAAEAFSSMAPPFIAFDGSTVSTRGDGATEVNAQFTVSGPPARELLRIRLSAIMASITVAPKMGHSYDAAAVAGISNSPALVDRAVTVVRRALGESSIRLIETMVPAFSEDFGSFQARVPGVFFFLGVANPAKNTAGMPHSPDYVADDGAIAVGVRAMSAVLLDSLR